MVHQERKIPDCLRVVETSPQHRTPGCSRSLLHLRPDPHRKDFHQKEKLCHSLHRTLHHSESPPCHARIMDRYDCTVKVWYQHDRVLQLNCLCPSRRFDHWRAPCIMGIRSRQLPLRLASYLDHQYIRSMIAPAVYLPADGVDSVGRRNVLLHSRFKQSPSRSCRALHLHVRSILLARRRACAIYLLCRGVSSVAS
jgi:hypothetical protein